MKIAQKISTIAFISLLSACSSNNNQISNKPIDLYSKNNSTDFESVFINYIKQSNLTKDDISYYILSDKNKNKELSSLKQVNLPTDDLYVKTKNEIITKSQQLKSTYIAPVGLSFYEFQQGKGLQLYPTLDITLVNTNGQCERIASTLGSIGECKDQLEPGGADTATIKFNLEKWFLAADVNEAKDIQMLTTSNPTKHIGGLITYTLDTCNKDKNTNNITCQANIRSIDLYKSEKFSVKNKPFASAVEIK